MKGLAGFSFLIALGFILNAFDGKWAIDRKSEGAQYVWLDIGLAVVFLIVSFALFAVARRQEEREMLAQYNEMVTGERRPESPQRTGLISGIDASGVSIKANAPADADEKLPNWSSVDNPPGWYAHPGDGSPRYWDGSAFRESE
jgi:hypothetical protein